MQSRQYNRKILNWITLLYYKPGHSTNVPMIICKPSNKKVKIQEGNICSFYNFKVEKALSKPSLKIQKARIRKMLTKLTTLKWKSSIWQKKP